MPELVLLVAGIVVLIGGYLVVISSELPVWLPLFAGMGLIGAGSASIRRARGSDAPLPPPP